MSANNDRQVLVVRIPDRSTLDECEFRDYVASSLSIGVLAIRESVTLEFMSFPELGGVTVCGQELNAESFLMPGISVLCGTESKGNEEHLAIMGESAVDHTAAQNNEVKKAAIERAERKAIIERLRRYRQQGGLGSFNPLAVKSGISADVLRDIHNGAISADLKQHRRIAKGLDKLNFEIEPKEPANG